MKLTIPNGVSRAFHKVGFQLKKHSPEILVVTGVVGMVASTVLACKATTKAGAIIEDAKEQIGGMQQVYETPELREKYSEKYNGEEYTEEAFKKDRLIVYTKTGVELAKIYAPAVILGALSIASILTSHNIIRKRNIALAAAYTAVDNSFKDYRGRVVERFGKELDKELKYNIKAKEVEETVTNEDGTETTVKKTVHVADVNMPSEFAIFFDETCTGWTKDAEHNKFFLKRAQDWANEKLQKQTYLFLNDVLESLGAQKTSAGQIVGWIYDPRNPNHKGDNYVDFGIFNDVNNEQKRLFVNGYERSVLIDFNVDGPIYNKFTERPYL